MFGRGGEEIETLSAHRIPFEVVPGITAALGVAAYAGIPLTHRDYAQSCVFVTGTLKDGSMDLDWPALARPRQTIVVYMGLPGLALLCEHLVAHGLAARTPAAIVQQGTAAAQRVVAGTLKTLPQRAARAKLHGPTLVIVGDVVRLRRPAQLVRATARARLGPVHAMATNALHSWKRPAQGAKRSRAGCPVRLCNAAMSVSSSNPKGAGGVRRHSSLLSSPRRPVLASSSVSIGAPCRPLAFAAIARTGPRMRYPMAPAAHPAG